jgi:type II secretory ATPase GspE/PulE/Tfp pilus assembly ATPase PilB-like protein/DNA-binding response OmpR family regulator
MGEEKKPLIIFIDDEKDILKLMEVYLKPFDCEIIYISNPLEAINIVKSRKPNLIFMDIIMPDINGFELCSKLYENGLDSLVPIIFMTSLDEEEDRIKAFSVGASDFIKKPIKKEVLIKKIEDNFQKSINAQQVKNGSMQLYEMLTATKFEEFKEFVCTQLSLSEEIKNQVKDIDGLHLEDLAKALNINERQLSYYVSAVTHIPYLQYIDMEYIKTGIFSASFCKTNLILPVWDKENSRQGYALSNPYNHELIAMLDDLAIGKKYTLSITEPQNILVYISEVKKSKNSKVSYKFDLNIDADKDQVLFGAKTSDLSPDQEHNDESVTYIAKKLLFKAITERASDIHIEPKDDKCFIRFRVDGELVEIANTEPKTGSMLINHFKAVGNLDVSEKIKPQDGSVDVVIDDRVFRLRLASTSTPSGESMIMRVIDPNTGAKNLNELGLTKSQSEKIAKLGNASRGLILIVGPTGSGKTTTIYSLLATINCKQRSLLTVEDPVEYKIPYGNQQEVNLKRNLTFDILLKSVVRQDPDILFLGEIRDAFSAQTALDFASTGHLTISTLHTDNAVSALFRLQRLGVERSSMAESILGVIAQRLIKKPCRYCTKLANITPEEIEILKPFTDDIPEKVIQPVGCLKCNNTGYKGREGVYEIFEMDHELAKMIRDGEPVMKIRSFMHARKDYLIGQHAVDKVRDHIFAVKDVQEKVLCEELDLMRMAKKECGVSDNIIDIPKNTNIQQKNEPISETESPTLIKQDKPSLNHNRECEKLPTLNYVNSSPVNQMVDDDKSTLKKVPLPKVNATTQSETEEENKINVTDGKTESTHPAISKPNESSASESKSIELPEQAPIPIQTPPQYQHQAPPQHPNQTPYLTPSQNQQPQSNQAQPQQYQPPYPNQYQNQAPLPQYPNQAPYQNQYPNQAPSQYPQQNQYQQYPPSQQNHLKSILVIDDDKEMRTYVQLMLKKNANYTIDTAEDGVNALLKIGANKYDLIISDINMPNLDGLTLLTILKQQNVTVPLILLSANSAPEDEIKGLELGASDFIKKPVRGDILRARVNRILNPK